MHHIRVFYVVFVKLPHPDGTLVPDNSLQPAIIREQKKYGQDNSLHIPLKPVRTKMCWLQYRGHIIVHGRIQSMFQLEVILGVFNELICFAIRIISAMEGVQQVDIIHGFELLDAHLLSENVSSLVKARYENLLRFAIGANQYMRKRKHI